MFSRDEKDEKIDEKKGPDNDRAMLFNLSRGGKEFELRVHHQEKVRNNSILAIEMNVVGTSASIAIVISFINKIMRKCSQTTKQLYPELSVRIPSRLKRGEDAEEDGSEGK